MKETSKIIDINEKRLSDKYLVQEIRKADLYHGSGWLNDKRKEFLEVYCKVLFKGVSKGTSDLIFRTAIVAREKMYSDGVKYELSGCGVHIPYIALNLNIY